MIFDGELDEGGVGEITRLIVAIDLGDEVIIEHFADEQQPLHINALALKEVIERGTGTMDATRKLGIAHSPLIDFGLNDAPNIDLFKITIHSSLYRAASNYSSGCRTPDCSRWLQKKREELNSS